MKASHSSSASRPKRPPNWASAALKVGGLTLIEVLVIVALIAVIAGFLVPIHSEPRRPKNPQCLTNLKQITLGWLMYANDYGDRLVANQPYASLARFPTNNWVGGLMDWSANPANTNTQLLLQFGLSPYIKSAAVYHCAADDSISAAGPRVRSYSMNAFVGESGRGPVKAGWKQHLKMSHFTHPTATFIVTDEHPNSIDDAWFFNDPAETNRWSDLPASRHNGAAGLSFADGHSEIRRWQGSRIHQPMASNRPKPRVRPDSEKDRADLSWVLQRSTESQTNNVDPEANSPSPQ